MSIKRTILSAGIVVALAASTLLVAETLSSKEDAIKAAYPEATATEEVQITLTADQIAAVKTAYNWELPGAQFKFYVSKKADAVIGRTIFVGENGKHGMIWLSVSVNPDGTLQDSVVCSMAEVKGKPVASKQFLKQFFGKKADSPMNVGKEIQGVTGATISSKSVTAAIKKGLILVKTAFPAP
jgi:Na+-translocating ferredoxin:NAD+ oxidoreductase RnfG subunit